MSYSGYKRSYGAASAPVRAAAATTIQSAVRGWLARRSFAAQKAAKPIVVKAGPAPEQKVVDTLQANYSMDTSGTVVLLNGVAIGTDYTDRNGRKIRVSSIQIRGFIRPSDNGTAPSCVRWMIVYDKQPNGALPTAGDVLRQLNGTSMLNLSNRDRFRVLVDKQYAIGGISDTATQAYAMSPTVYNVKWYKSCNLDVVFDGTTSAISDLQSGSIFLLTIGTEAAATAATLQASLRIRFTDA